ncbi:unannotated protein [freshwater metagenome]|uniref:peptidylprolyl isomerase n=1 Tax=freshwater metagenome TaxID=449393 RepID=A0A6J6F7R6_9ZZZZ|nr:hypothetical protein [Actinomycetota bacterium]
MKSIVENLTVSSVHLSVEVTFTEFEVHIAKSYARASAGINVPGFRRGKTPASIVNIRIGRPKVISEAIRSAIPDFFEKALVEHGLFAIGRPTFRVENYIDYQPLTFSTEINIRPAIDLPDFSEISVTVSDALVNEEDINEKLKEIQLRFAEHELSQGVIRDDEFLGSDAFASSISDFKTLIELKNDIATNLTEMKKVEQGAQARDLVLEKLMSDLDIALPEDLIEKEVNEHLARENRSEDLEHRTEVDLEVRKSLKSDYLLDVVSRSEQIHIDDAEINEYLVRTAQHFSMSPQEFADQLEKSGQIQSLMAEVARSKALAIVLSRITVREVSGKVIEL